MGLEPRRGAVEVVQHEVVGALKRKGMVEGEMVW
jgi:hypothetical protein